MITFGEEEELRLLLEALGRVHDCTEAGCEVDPEGRPIRLPDGSPNPEARPSRRPGPTDRVRELLAKLRGVPIAEAEEAGPL